MGTGDQETADFDSTRSVEAQADWWLVKMELNGDDPDLRRRFEVWLEKDVAHALAYSHAQGLWADMAVAAVGLDPDTQMPVVQPIKRRFGLGRALFLVALLVIGAFVLPSPALYWADHANRAALTKLVLLQDGTRVTLRRNSAIDVQYSKDQRQVTLVRGAAYFQVHHNPDRPFLVRAGRSTARAIGTAYGVTDLGQAVRVDVREGTVGFGVTGAEADLALTAEKAAVLKAGAQHPLPVAYKAGALAWLDGHMVVKDQQAASIIAQLEEYQGGKVILLNQSFYRTKLSGRFDLSNSQQAIEDIAALLGAEVFWLTPRLGIIK